MDPQRARVLVPDARSRRGPARTARDASLTAPDHPPVEVDFHWPTHHLIVELDGWETHRTRAAFEQDRARDAALTAAGWRVVRFTWHEPRDTIQRRLQALLPG
jgi:hypothetical protein